MINAHAARELAGTHVTIVAVDLGNGTVAYVGSTAQHLTSSITPARLTAIAEKMAKDLQFNRHDPLPGHWPGMDPYTG